MIKRKNDTDQTGIHVCKLIIKVNHIENENIKDELKSV